MESQPERGPAIEDYQKNRNISREKLNNTIINLFGKSIVRPHLEYLETSSEERQI